ncbi:MAG: hypothetical protein JWN14_1182 [Chthonomonadales bacterium]|nr:hypothetical protein [Chthonomonadales bacterium]
MIGYPITLIDLTRLVSARFPAKRNRDGTPRKNAIRPWRGRARQQTDRLRSQGFYSGDEKTEIWSELNRLFAALQGGGKCAYCETRLADHKREGVRGDIEHYRPKAGVIDWPNKHNLSTGGSDPHAYYLLAFHLRNYLLACDTCNREFKRNYFPIAGPRCPAHSRRPRDLKRERPYLLHPLDPTDEDPEQLIEFIGIDPVPRAPQGTPQYWRAVVTIELLGLGRGKRFNLDFERSLVMAGLYQALNAVDPTDPIVVRTINALQDDTWPHVNCLRSFKRLHDKDPRRAKLLVEEATTFVDKVWANRKQLP